MAAMVNTSSEQPAWAAYKSCVSQFTYRTRHHWVERGLGKALAERQQPAVVVERLE